MTRRIKKVGVDEKVPVKLSVGDRELITQHTLADPGLTDRIEAAVPVRSRITGYYTLSELEDLQGFIAAETNQHGVGSCSGNSIHSMIGSRPPSSHMPMNYLQSGCKNLRHNRAIDSDTWQAALRALARARHRGRYAPTLIVSLS